MQQFLKIGAYIVTIAVGILFCSPLIFMSYPEQSPVSPRTERNLFPLWPSQHAESKNKEAEDWKLLMEKFNQNFSLETERPQKTMMSDFLYHPPQAPFMGNVILLHGLGSSMYEMEDLALFLAQHGYAVFNYNWGISGNIKSFLAKFREAKIPGKYFFLTHSFGGIRLGNILVEMTETERRNISGILMLAPPATPDEIIKYSLKGVDRDVNNDIFYSEEFKHLEFSPPIYVIAGKSDEYLKQEETEVPGARKHILIPATHSELRDPSVSGKEILNVLEACNSN